MGRTLKTESECQNDGGCAGLTLIELLVSISILSVVGGAILLALYSGILVWEKAGGYDQKRIEVMLALEDLERDARNSFPFYAIAFVGNATSVKFAGTRNEATDEGPARGFCEIEYSFDPSSHVLSRRVSGFPDAGTGDGVARRVITGAASVKVTYADIPERAGATPVWLEEWNSRDRLPMALRVDLEFSGTGEPISITRTIDLPVRAVVETRDVDTRT